jgi:hypothetical protein
VSSMQNTHWTKEDLVNHLYGVGPEDGHLGDCDQCRRQWLQLSQAKQGLPVEEVDHVFLAVQRQQILSRIERGASLFSFRWASAMAAATALAFGVWFYVPVQPDPHMLLVPASDEQLLKEVSQATQDYEPRAAAPMRELFADTQ